MRATSTIWMLGLFGLIFLVIVGERVASSLRATPLPPRPRWAPDFNPHEPAPDFELPDAKGKRHRLKELIEGATVVGFAGEDGQSILLFRYLGILRRKMGKYSPRFITVAAFSPEKEAAFRRQTDLPQIILYEKKGGPVAARYKADPGPRVYSLSRTGTVRSVGLSRMEASILAIANTAALDLGFKSTNSPDVDRRAPVPAGLDSTDPMKGIVPSQGADPASLAPATPK